MDEVEGEGGAFAHWAAEAAGASLRQVVETVGEARAAGAGADATEGRPGVRFDQDWFDRTCDVPKSAVKDNVFYTQGDGGLGSGWVQYRRCSKAPDQTFEDVTEDTVCTRKCREVAAQSPGNPYCCEFHKDHKECSVSKGWQAVEDSSYGGIAGWRTPKQVQMVKIPAPESTERSYAEADDMQKYFDLLVEQVNHMSIPGIIEHMLSFYVCMRWVPDQQYMEVAKFEQEHVDVDEVTQMKSNATDADLIKAYTDFDMMPMKCSTSINVRDHDSIDLFLQQFNAPKSDLRDAYQFSKKISSKSWVFEGSTWKRWSSRVTETEEAMKERMMVDEMVDVAHRVLPWDGFIRSSLKLKEEGLEVHVSQPKNLFFLCFGPRIASFPHKRQGGKHVLADQNMAGCNGLWDFDTMRDHMLRIRRMFSPETCLVESLDRKLKAVFLQNFMTMNMKFEDVLNGEFQRQDAKDILRGSPQEYLDRLLEESSDLNGTSMQLGGWGTGSITRKYQRTARLLANAHSKWLVCDTKPTVPSRAFGFSDDAFRGGSAYAKWLPELRAEGELKCTVLDSKTGCMKCTTGVFTHPHRCAIKDTINYDQIFRQVRHLEKPLVTRYMTSSFVETKVNASQVQFVTKEGFCLGALRSPRAGAPSHQFERVVRVEQEGGGFKTFRRSELGSQAASRLEACLKERDYGRECRSEPNISRGMFSGETALYIDTQPGCPAESEMAKVQRCVEDLDGSMLDSYDKKDFGPLHVFEEYVPTKNNKKEHLVQFLYVCPCNAEDESLREEFSSFAHTDPI